MIPKVIRNIVLLVIIVPLALFYLLILSNPSQIETTLQCFNSTILEIDMKIINDSAHEFEGNMFNKNIPLINHNDEERPLTERINYLIGNGIYQYEFINKSLNVTSDTITQGIYLETTLGNKPENFSTESFFHCFPFDYDDAILYTLYKNGFSTVNLSCIFIDYYSDVFSRKIFYVSNEQNDIFVSIQLRGGVFLIKNYDILIVTKNQTLGNSMKEKLNEERRTANSINVINKNPYQSIQFLC